MKNKMAISSMIRRGLIGAFLMLGATPSVPVTEAARAARRGDSGGSAEDFQAKEMLNKGLEFIELRQFERGEKMLASIPRMFPTSSVRFPALIELGKYYQEKGDFLLAVRQFNDIPDDAEDDLRAEALYRTGISYYHLNNFDRAFMTLRRVTTEYPWSVFANEAYYYIGLCHFKLGRWSKAVEALEMVGTRVPENQEDVVLAEAGQRMFVKVMDQDLIVLQETGGIVEATVKTAAGDSERITMAPLGKSGIYFLGSLATEPGAPNPGDGILQVAGNERVEVFVEDRNTESGEQNVTRITTVRMVSTATGGFTDGAFREYMKGVFGDNECFVRIKDLDRDRTDQPDTVTCELLVTYTVKKERDDSLQGVDLSGESEEVVVVRDRMVLTLTETGPHTGLFTGKAVTRVVESDEEVDMDDMILSVRSGDQIEMRYVDELHIEGGDARVLSATANVLVGSIQDVKIENREVQSMDVMARKQLIESRIFLRLGQIFKEVGLNAEASEKADEGLDRVDDVLRLSTRTNLDRSITEEAFSVKWDLLLVQDRLREAIQVCRTLMQLFPESTLVDNALMKIAGAKLESDDPDEIQESIAIFSSVQALKNSDLQGEAAFRIAQAYEKLALQHAAFHKRAPDLTRAMQAYKSCAENFPESPFAGEALDNIINFYINTQNYQNAIALMERVYQDYPDAGFLDMVLFKWGVAAYRMNDLNTALEKFNQLIMEYPDSSVAEKAQKSRDTIARRL